ncbi:acetylornithine deacetylase [Candidatus Persebacteraceae bacterium Df01]|jgi:acetylornithine deacetylase|uniref:Acetylornithine deacetylase n=1 Tax=Candidatus Doriopsillibacter californiensis TaxID=2970740 RepID=A0ABT7QJX4_9GAMM|nr:acetylornithine deacetylase [Candidatus Persebacteraceae bacterium Df01]
MTTHPRLPDAIQWLRELVAFDTIPSHNNINLVRYVETKLREININSTICPTNDGGKASLLATIGPTVDGGVVLSGHTDVVDTAGQQWATPPFELCESNGRLYARGSCDMKGFVACALAMAPVFSAATLSRPIHLAFSRDEETGCLGSADILALLKDSGMKPAAAIVGEPTHMKIIAGHKSGVSVKTIFHGVPAHSATPAAGISAIRFAARFITHLESLETDLRRRAPADSPFVPPHATVNTGVITGGTALNIIAARCEVNWHYRGMPSDKPEDFVAQVEDFLQNTLLPEMRASGHPATIENIVNSFEPALAPRPDSPAHQIAVKLTGNTDSDVVPFCTEAGHFQQDGISAVVIGPGDIAQAHKPDEYIEISQLAECLHFLDNLCTHLTT